MDTAFTNVIDWVDALQQEYSRVSLIGVDHARNFPNDALKQLVTLLKAGHYNLTTRSDT